MNITAILILACFLSWILHPLAIRVSQAFNIVDNPYRDKIHKNPTPVLGGPAIGLAILLSVLAANTLGLFAWSRTVTGILVGGTLIMLVGLIDDRLGMTATLKMAGQFLAAGLFVVFADVHIGIFNVLIEFGFSIFFIMAMMNSFNILDNMDAVTGSMSFAAGTAFLAVAILSGDTMLSVIAAALVGAVIGFMRYNMPRAKIFMGDSGAMLLGYLFGAMTVIYLAENRSFYFLATPFLILSYPIFDISLVSLSRLRETRSLAVAAPDSSPYRLVRWTFSAKTAFIVILVLNLILGAMGTAAFILSDSQISVLLILISGLALSALGVHLYRNFLYFIERTAAFILDLFSINLSFYLIYSLKYRWGVLSYDVYVAYSEMIAPALWISVFWVIFFSVMGIYEIRADRRFRQYIAAIVKIVGAGIVCFLVLNLFYEGSIVVSPLPIFLYAGLLILLNIILKYGLFLVVRAIHRKPESQPRVALFVHESMIVPDGLIATLRRDFRLDGYVCRKRLDGDLAGLEYLGEPVCLNEILRSRRIEKVVIAWPETDYSDFSQYLRASYFLENQFIVAGAPPPLFKGLKVERLYRGGYYRISMEFMRTWEWIVKRGMDICLSAALLILSSPVFLAKFVGSKLGGYPFLVRVPFFGRDGREKTFADFGGRRENDDDDFVLRPGLPALIAVFNGDLSFVGTLPLTPAQYQKDSVVIPGFWRRKLIKPGLTGPAHHAGREKYFDKELDYMSHMSILLDIWWILTGLLSLINLIQGKKKDARFEVHPG